MSSHRAPIHSPRSAALNLSSFFKNLTGRNRRGPPKSLLIGGTPQMVDDYMKSMLDDCKEGGMMMYPGADGGISGDARPENVKALLDAVKKYGKY